MRKEDLKLVGESEEPAGTDDLRAGEETYE